MNRTRSLVFAGLCVALGVVLPIALHSIPNAGQILLPMHLPVLLCGLLCGPWIGLACGVLAPLISSLATGMPPAAMLPSMLCELAVYGLVSGLLLRCIKTGHRALNIYAALLCAMLAGRVVYGILNALIFRAGAYSMQVWLTAAFVTSIPGIIVQLIVIPAILLVLGRAKIVELG